MAIPECITRELFEKALKTFLNNQNIKILEYSCSLAVPHGDNYTSDLHRIHIEYSAEQNKESNTMSVLVKSWPKSRPELSAAVDETKLFKREIEMYTKILPALHKTLGALGTLSAKCIYAEEYPIPLMILEDLSPLNYKMQDRREGLDLEHCLLVVKKIAQLHAASLIIYEKDSTTFKNFDWSMFSGCTLVDLWVNAGVEDILKVCKKRLGMGKYVDKLARLQNKINERCKKAVKPKPGHLNVLNHGDCWINNILFLHDSNGKPKDLRFVDFQISVYSSTALDMQYFWATSPNMEVRQNHFETLLNNYYDELLSTLTKLNYSIETIPSTTDFKKEFASMACYGFAGTVTTLALIKCDIREDASLEELVKPGGSEGTFRHHVFTNPLAWEYIEYMLDFLDNLGLFEDF